jgi:hypothetical protein
MSSSWTDIEITKENLTKGQINVADRCCQYTRFYFFLGPCMKTIPLVKMMRRLPELPDKRLRGVLVDNGLGLDLLGTIS